MPHMLLQNALHRDETLNWGLLTMNFEHVLSICSFYRKWEQKLSKISLYCENEHKSSHFSLLFLIKGVFLRLLPVKCYSTGKRRLELTTFPLKTLFWLIQGPPDSFLYILKFFRLYALVELIFCSFTRP